MEPKIGKKKTLFRKSALRFPISRREKPEEEEEDEDEQEQETANGTIPKVPANR